MLARRLVLALALAWIPGCTSPAPTASQAEPAKAEATKEGGAGWGRMFGRKDPEWKLEFKEPGPGPRAPVTAGMLVDVGVTRVADVEALTQKLGLKCGDTSIRAMMEERRKAERKRIEEAKARGEDAVTAASWLNYKSKREANPQVRYSCPKTDSATLTDRARPPSNGRILFVFDSADHPLRHVSYQRTYKVDKAADALADYHDAAAYYARVYGPPTRPPTKDLPTPAPDGAVEFAPTVNYESEWSYSDLTVKVGILRYADMITVGERVEVPHGIRPDAPALGKAPAAPAGAPAPAQPAAVAQPAPTPAAASPAAPSPATATPAAAAPPKPAAG